MTKQKVQKKKTNSSLEQSKNKKVSIQFNLDGFSFCIINLDTNKTIHFCEYTFTEKLETPDKLVFEIKQLFKEDIHLQQEFKEILVIHDNNLATIVPNRLFNENHLKEYLSLNIKTLATDFFAFDTINTIDAKNVYVPFVNVNNYMFQNFGEFEYKHANSILLEKLLQKEITEEKNMFVNVTHNHFTIVVIENKKLLLSNTFTFETKEDFIYYILFTAEQLGLNTNEFPLYFMGDIEKESEIYNITYQYVRNVNFLESENSFFTNSSFSKHNHFTLLG